MYVVIESYLRDPAYPNADAMPDAKVKEAEDRLVAQFKRNGVDAIILPPGYRMSYGGMFVTNPEDPNRPADEPSRPT